MNAARGGKSREILYPPVSAPRKLLNHQQLQAGWIMNLSLCSGLLSLSSPPPPLSLSPLGDTAEVCGGPCSQSSGPATNKHT